MKGRPRIVARDIAIAQGKTRYHGRPCPKCGGTLRQTANYSCVECDLERHRTRRRFYRPSGERAEALARGDVYYTGQPCKRGHDGKRYSRSGHCVECVLHVYRIRKAAKEAPRYGLPKYRPKPKVEPYIIDANPEPDKMGWQAEWGRFKDDPRACKRDHTRYTPRHPMVDAA